jgi:DoxX-like family
VTAPSPWFGISRRDESLLRFSVAFVWLATAIVSLCEIHGQSLELLLAASVTDPAWQTGTIFLGAAVDAVLGLVMLLRPGRTTYLVALWAMVLMTVAATILIPGLWLHPLGPLTKNVPIAAALWILSRTGR